MNEPIPDSQSIKEKAITSGKRRTNRPIIRVRDTGDDNMMDVKVVKDNHERRKLLEQESTKGLPKELIYDPTKPIDSMQLFKDEKIIYPTKRKPDEKPITEA